MPTHEALRLAEEKGLDLVEISPRAFPPVCRIMDYGKYKYEEAKKKQQARKRASTVETKEIKFRPKTEEHDMAFKVKHVRRFLEGGNKVRLAVVFRGREITHPQTGMNVLNRVVDMCADIATVEATPEHGRSPHDHGDRAQAGRGAQGAGGRRRRRSPLRWPPRPRSATSSRAASRRRRRLRRWMTTKISTRTRSTRTSRTTTTTSDAAADDAGVGPDCPRVTSLGILVSPRRLRRIAIPYEIALSCVGRLGHKTAPRVMPKVKTHSGAKKRFKRTASGKFKFAHVFKRHLLTGRSKKRKRQLAQRGVRAARASPPDRRVAAVRLVVES